MQLLALSPVASKSFSVPSGAVYVADGNGVIANIQSLADMAGLVAAGCAQLSPPPSELIGKLLAADFNSTADQQIPLNIIQKYRVRRIVVENTTVNGMSTAAGGVYSAAAKATGQGIIVAAGQVYTRLTNAVTALELTLALPNLILTALTPLYFSLTTGHGSAAFADIYVYGDVYN